jgi:hypothetical protein
MIGVYSARADYKSARGATK